MNNAVDNIYSGAAAVGQARVWIGAVVSTFFAVLMVGLGCWFLWENWHLSEDKTAVANSDSVCQQNDKLQTCVTNITYVVNGKSYTKDFQGGVSYKAKDIVPVFYVADDPENAEIELPTKQFSALLIGGGVALSALSWGFVWLVNRYKPLAAFEGVATAYNFLK